MPFLQLPGKPANYLAVVHGYPVRRRLGIVLTGVGIAAVAGVQHDEQGAASSLASTTLSVGNAIGLALLIAVADGTAAGQVGVAYPSAVGQGITLVFRLVVAGIVVSLLAVLTPRRKASVTGF